VAWRILLAVWEHRTDAKLAEKMVDVQTHFDQKGTTTMDRFREYAEALIPALAKERERQSRSLDQQLSQVGRMGPMVVSPVQGMHAWQSLRYAKELASQIK